MADLGGDGEASGDAWGASGQGVSWLFGPFPLACWMAALPCTSPALSPALPSPGFWKQLPLEAPPDPGHPWSGRGRVARSGARAPGAGSVLHWASLLLHRVANGIPSPLSPAPAWAGLLPPCCPLEQSQSPLAGADFLPQTSYRRQGLTRYRTPPLHLCRNTFLLHLSAQRSEPPGGWRDPRHQAPIWDGVGWRVMPGPTQPHHPLAVRSYF